MLPVCELERHWDDSLLKNKLWSQLIVFFFLTLSVNTRPTFAFLFSSEDRFISTESCDASTLPLDFCWWVHFNGCSSVGTWGPVSVNASCYDSYLPLPLSAVYFSLCAQSHHPSPQPAVARLLQLWIRHLRIHVRCRLYQLDPAQRWYWETYLIINRTVDFIAVHSWRFTCEVAIVLELPLKRNGEKTHLVSVESSILGHLEGVKWQN